MKLAELTAGIDNLTVAGDQNVDITGICYDSRQAASGYLFCALRGERFDGGRFVDDALAAGAVAVLCEKPADCNARAVLQSDNPRAAMAELAARFYGRPTESMLVAGITGTNGKTTVSYLLESLLSRAGKHVAVVGTVAYRFGADHRPAANTTPESVDLQRLAAEFRTGGADALVMEVSSHALAQQRVAGVAFDIGLFTNLTPEHLDYHRDMESYFAAKRLLFDRRTGAKQAVINIDDPWGLRLALERPDAMTCGQDETARVRIISAELGISGITAVFDSPAGRIEVRSPLLGRFNLANLCCAAAAGVALGLDPALIAEALGAVERVPGRLEAIDHPGGARILVDYAHTGDALEKALEAMRDLKPRRLVALFGCGGDRDRSKRPKMGEVSGRLADLTVVTSDNPRSEEPQAIINEILPGVEAAGAVRLDRPGFPAPGRKGYLVEPDRRRAIEMAVSLLEEGDLLLVAGKGHEDYQIIGERRIHFDDREEVRRAIALTMENG